MFFFLTVNDLHYLGGLSDGEAYIGVVIWKDSSRNHGYGYGVRPKFAVDLGYPDSLSLRYFQKETGYGQIFKNRKSGHTWVVRSKTELKVLLELLEPYVRFKRTRTKIHLVLEFLKVMPGTGRHSPERWRRELEIMLALRKLSRRTRNKKHHDIQAILDKFLRDLRASHEAMVGGQAPEREPNASVDADNPTSHPK